MDPETALSSWLDAAPNRERSGDFAGIRLDRYRRFLGFLPPPPAPCTVAGTKGKGSTVRLIEGALLAHGVPTIAFTSPHVRSVCERWRVDGIPVAAEVLLPLTRVVAAVEQRSGIGLTYFERTAALAVLLAANRPGCQLLWEVGLGGRLDCANALDCAVAVLTHLSHDHRDILGPTLTHIAGEKLPIVRAGQPLLIAPQSAEAHAAIRSQLPLIVPASVPVTWVAREPRRFSLALSGEHQQDNASTALAAVRLLLPQMDEQLARRGMAGTALAARCQLLTVGGRRILIDGAHNGPSVAATLAVAHQQLRPGWHLVLGLASDKEIDEILPLLTGLSEVVTIHRCGYESPRARRAGDWPPALLAKPWHDSVRQALAALPAGDLCVTGSFYLAGEALQALDPRGSLPG